MEDTLKQVGELLLSSIPTMICLLVVWAAYRFLVFTRLQKVLEQRHALTEGAIKKAKAEVAAAAARVAQYEQKLRDARAAIFKQQEVRRQQILNARNAALDQARKEAEGMVKSARASLEQEVLAAKGSLQKQADELADEIIRMVLKPAAAAAAGGR